MAGSKRCPCCGSTKVRVEQPARYDFAWSGLDGVVLDGDGVRLTECTACGESTTTIRNLAQLLQVIGLTLVLGGPGLTGQELACLRSLFDLSQADMARATGRGRRETIADWEAHGGRAIFRSPFDEIGLRVVLMALFRERVIGSPSCCLSRRHIRQFEAAAASFVARAGKLPTDQTAHGPLSLRRTVSTGDWRPSTARVT